MGGVCSASQAVQVSESTNGKESVHSTPCNRVSTRALVLSEHEVKLIKHTWRRLDDDMTGRGAKIFREIFALQPEVKGLFNFSYIPDDELQGNMLFKAHAARFMQVICAVIDNIEELDSQLTPTLQNLGQVHATTHSVGMEYFDLFKTAMLRIWQQDLGHYFTEDVRVAWTKVFDYILTELKYGFCSAYYK